MELLSGHEKIITKCENIKSEIYCTVLLIASPKTIELLLPILCLSITIQFTELWDG